MGYSIGTGIAAHLAAERPVKALVLKAPYESLEKFVAANYAFLPSFILRYPLRTDRYLEDVRCPVTIFHGVEDQLFSISESQRLKNRFGETIRLIPLPNAGHNNLANHPVFRSELGSVLNGTDER